MKEFIFSFSHYFSFFLPLLYNRKSMQIKVFIVFFIIISYYHIISFVRSSTTSIG